MTLLLFYFSAECAMVWAFCLYAAASIPKRAPMVILLPSLWALQWLKSIPFLRYYNVFHISQCEGLKARHTAPLPGTVNASKNAETIIGDYHQCKHFL